MALTQSQISERVRLVAHQAFFRYFVNRDVVPAAHPLTRLVFPGAAAVRSQIGGLETSLGTGLWQRLAQDLARENGVKTLDPETIKRPSTDVGELENLAKQYPTLAAFSTAVAKSKGCTLPNALTWKQMTKGDGVDFYFLRELVEYPVDIKTAQINAKNGQTFHETFVRWIVYRKMATGGSASLQPKLVIPYDAELERSGGKKTWWDVYKDRARPLVQNDVWVGDEFWSRLTDCAGTWDAIRQGFESVAIPLRKLYEPLLQKRVGAPELHELLSAYGVTRLRFNSSRTSLQRACDCGQTSDLTTSAVESIQSKPVCCKSRRCKKPVLTAGDFNWLLVG